MWTSKKHYYRLESWIVAGNAPSWIRRENNQTVGSIIHAYMRAVRVDGSLTDWLENLAGVLNGCILAPTLFNILLEVVIALAVRDADNLGALTSGCRISTLRFADDIGVLAEGVENLQSLLLLIWLAKDLGCESALSKLMFNSSLEKSNSYSCI